MKIDLRETQFDPASGSDPSGQVFWWRGDVYRAIREPAASFYRDLFARGIIAQLCSSGLVHTEMTSLDLDGYDLIVRHERIQPLSYPFEWPSQMLRDAALLTIDLNLKLGEFGLTTKDAHGWNILFEGSRPRFVDLGSVAPDQGRSGPITGWDYEFQSSFLYPLYLMSIGKASLTRHLLFDVNNPVSMFAILKRLPQQLRLRCLLFDVTNGFLLFSSRSSFLHRLRHAVESINLPFPGATSSSSSDSDRSLPEPMEMRDGRHRVIADVLAKTRPESMLAIGADSERYAQLAARMGSRVVLIDTDEARLNVLCRDAARDGLPITPLIMDFRQASPACVLVREGYSEYNPPAAERLKGELVLALGVVHQLADRKGLSWEDLVSKLSPFCTKWLLVEFTAGDDRSKGEWSSDPGGWFSTESFVRELSKAFSQVEVLESYPAPPSKDDTSRKLLLCER